MELTPNPIKYKMIKCFLCKSALSDKVYEYSTSLLFGDEKYPIKSSLNLCNNCGLIFNNPRLTESSLEWLYNTSYGADTALCGSEGTKRLNTMRINFIKKYVGTFRSVIDIGCGDGSLLSSFRQLGKEVCGIEPNAYLRQYAKTNHNLDLMSERLDRIFAGQNRNKYDLVMFNEVLEHIYNPIEFLQLAAHITKGFIYFDVPNTLKPRHWNIADFFSCEHLTHFTKYSIQRLAQATGFEVVAIEEDLEDPILKVILKKYQIVRGDAVITSQEKGLEEVHQCFRDYKDKRNQSLQILKEKLSGITNAVIYGAGHHTIQMVENGLLEGITIRDIVDSNSKKHSEKFIGHQIKPPNILTNCPHPVIISTFGSQEDVASFIAKEFPRVRYIKLYEI